MMRAGRSRVRPTVQGGPAPMATPIRGPRPRSSGGRRPFPTIAHLPRGKNRSPAARGKADAGRTILRRDAARVAEGPVVGGESDLRDVDRQLAWNSVRADADERMLVRRPQRGLARPTRARGRSPRRARGGRAAALASMPRAEAPAAHGRRWTDLLRRLRLVSTINRLLPARLHLPQGAG